MYAFDSCWPDGAWIGNGSAKSMPVTENVLSPRTLWLGKMAGFGALKGPVFAKSNLILNRSNDHF
jgi:hypothetical protein